MGSKLFEVRWAVNNENCIQAGLSTLEKHVPLVEQISWIPEKEAHYAKRWVNSDHPKQKYSVEFCRVELASDVNLREEIDICKDCPSHNCKFVQFLFILFVESFSSVKILSLGHAPVRHCVLPWSRCIVIIVVLLLEINAMAWTIGVNYGFLVHPIIVLESLSNTLYLRSVFIKLWVEIVIVALVLVIPVLPLLLSIIMRWLIGLVSLTEVVLSHVSIHWWLINKLLALVDALEIIIIVDRSLMI